jgi:LacI family transcriptional regulator
MPKPPTLRLLAQRLNLSIATVSQALRDSPRTSAQTRARVQRAAAKAGYHVNPLLGAALSAVRNARHQQFKGTLALVDLPEEPRFVVFRREIAAGAAERARQLGFYTDAFELGPDFGLGRLGSVLAARGIAGALFMPFNVAQDLSAFDFRRLAAVQMDHSVIAPRLHTILPDHYISMIHTLERLTQRGYRRIGLCLEQQRDMRIQGKWSAAFHGFFRSHAPGASVPSLIEPGVTREAFLSWYKHYKPDLVVGHVQAMVDWLREAGHRVPEEVGFFNLNMTERTGPCAGLDLQPQRLGAAGIEAVIGMLHREEFGVPAEPHTITIEARWMEGPTVKEADPELIAKARKSENAEKYSGGSRHE